MHERIKMIRLTHELLEKCRTNRGGFTFATLIALGIKPYPLVSGWYRGLIGTEISEEGYAAAVEGREVFVKNKTRILNGIVADMDSKPTAPVVAKERKPLGPDQYAAYMGSPEWKNFRRMALAKASHRCQVCGSNLNLQVHHNNYDRLGCELLSDVVVLCEPCHNLHHACRDNRTAAKHYGKVIPRDYNEADPWLREKIRDGLAAGKTFNQIAEEIGTRRKLIAAISHRYKLAKGIRYGMGPGRF